MQTRWKLKKFVHRYKFTMDKKQVRKLLSEKRKNIPKDKKIIFDKEISRRIISTPCFENAEQVLIFASTEDEFDTRYILEKCRLENKNVFYPLCIDKYGKMVFKKVITDRNLVAGMYNIPEPEKSCEDYSYKENDVIIVPCLSVDKNGYRIGYGKGYYDRFLKGFHGVSICPCYEELLTDKLPTDENDISINFLVTQYLNKEFAK